MIPLKDNLLFPRRILSFTNLLILLNVIIFFFELTLPENQLNDLIYNYSLSAGHFSLIALISYQFLHGGWLHILGNMLYLWVFGNSVEYRLGNFKFLLFYLASGVVGGLIQMFLGGDGLPIIGASASIAGILGAYLIWYPYAQIKVLLPIFIIFTVVSIPALFILVLWFLTNIFNSYTNIVSSDVSNVAYLGHIGGFLFGIIVALTNRKTPASNHLPLQSNTP